MFLPALVETPEAHFMMSLTLTMERVSENIH